MCQKYNKKFEYTISLTLNNAEAGIIIPIFHIGLNQIQFNRY